MHRLRPLRVGSSRYVSSYYRSFFLFVFIISCFLLLNSGIFTFFINKILSKSFNRVIVTRAIDWKPIHGITKKLVG